MNNDRPFECVCVVNTCLLQSHNGSFYMILINFNIRLRAPRRRRRWSAAWVERISIGEREGKRGQKRTNIRFWSFLLIQFFGGKNGGFAMNAAETWETFWGRKEHCCFARQFFIWNELIFLDISKWKSCTLIVYVLRIALYTDV